MNGIARGERRQTDGLAGRRRREILSLAGVAGLFYALMGLVFGTVWLLFAVSGAPWGAEEAARPLLPSPAAAAVAILGLPAAYGALGFGVGALAGAGAEVAALVRRTLGPRRAGV